MVTVLGESIVCARRPPLHGTDADGLIQHGGMLIHEMLNPAKAALRAQRLRESAHKHLRPLSGERQRSEWNPPLSLGNCFSRIDSAPFDSCEIKNLMVSRLPRARTTFWTARLHSQPFLNFI